MKKFIFLTFTLFSTAFLRAQHSNDLAKEKEINLLKTNQSKFRNFENKIERKIYDDHFKSVEERITKGYTKNQFILDPSYSDFVQQIFQLFIQKNTQYQLGNPKSYIIDHNVPNASSAGFDYYFINSGIIRYLDNEYQLAAVIGHELAHNYLNHTRESIVQEAEFVQDFKKEFRSLKRSEMIKLIKSQDEVIQKKYDLANQSRKKEITADSLGYIFYKNLGYPETEYFNLLNKLQELDKNHFYTIKDETYYQIFEVDELKIKPKWLKLEKNELFAGLNFTEHIDKDSISSHPNTNDRKEWLVNQFKLSSDNSRPKEASETYNTLKQKAIDQYYNTLFINDMYGFALYHIINAKQNNVDRKDLDTNLGVIFHKLYEARTKHEFNKYIPIADPNDEDEDYHKFLNFVWNIPTPDFKILGEYYTKKAAL